MTQTAPVQDLTGTYTLDPTHTRIGFQARHAMVTKVRGNFDEFEGTAYIDAENPTNSKVEVKIQTASINTGNADRDGHLRSADFFDAENNPVITFTSTSVAKNGDDWTITGDLDMNGVSKPVSIDFEENGAVIDPFGNHRAGFEGSVTVNRKDWNLTWNAALETGGVLVSEKVKLEFDVAVVRAQG